MRASTADEMFALGQEAATSARSGDVILLCGDLGAGKTHWTKGFVHGLGCTEEVTSPTFGLVHEYRGGRLPVFHFDFYRLKDAQELVAMGWDEYLDEDGIVIAEWGDRFPEVFPQPSIRISIQTESDGARTLHRSVG